MKRKKIFFTGIRIITIFFIILFLRASIVSLANAQGCDQTLNEFSDGSLSQTVTIPVGGGVVETSVTLPTDSTICSATLEIDRAAVGLGGTPYIWVPLSGLNQLVQIRTFDGTIERTFSNGAFNCAGTAFSNPSRITVIPGGDVWVANRNNGTVTRLGLVDPANPLSGYECKGTYGDVGGGPRGVTFDANGNIWVGDYNTDRMCRYRSDGTLINCASSGCRTYGMIGDSSGNVWVADRANSQICRCSGAIACAAVPATVGIDIYGIGMDNEEDIWFASYAGALAYEIDTPGLAVRSCGNVGVAYGPRGIAVDGLNRIWVANSGDNNFYVIDQSCNLVASTATGYSDVIGVAIDMDNRGWIVSNGSGRVLKYEVSGGSLNQLLDINVGDSPYNYSDMTGFRTPKILIVIGIPPGGSYSPTSFPATVDFTVALQNSLSGCVGGVAQQEDFCGNSYCEVTFSLSSTFVGGDYTLRQLNVSYRNPLSQITGGLVPCGRHCDDLETAVREDVPCTLCHILVLIKRIIDFATGIIAFPILVLMIIVGGITWITAGGSESRISRGKEIIRTAVIAIIILLAAWLIIDTVIVFLTPAGALWQNWSTINCPVP